MLQIFKSEFLGKIWNKPQGALTKDSVAYFINLRYDYAIIALKEFDMTKSLEHQKRGNFNEKRLTRMLKAYEHQQSE